MLDLSRMSDLWLFEYLLEAFGGIAEAAEAAGISRSTGNKIVYGKGCISKRTRGKLEKAVIDLWEDERDTAEAWSWIP